MKHPVFESYPLTLRALSEEEGGGWLATFPDLPGCMADGETTEEAIADARNAFSCWMAAHIEDGREIPVPGSGGEASGTRRGRPGVSGAVPCQVEHRA